MPKKGFSKVEKIGNKPASELIPKLLKEMEGLSDVAEHLGISQATLSRWLKSNGFIQVRVWVKGDTTE